MELEKFYIIFKRRKSMDKTNISDLEKLQYLQLKIHIRMYKYLFISRTKRFFVLHFSIISIYAF